MERSRELKKEAELRRAVVVLEWDLYERAEVVGWSVGRSVVLLEQGREGVTLNEKKKTVFTNTSTTVHT